MQEVEVQMQEEELREEGHHLATEDIYCVLYTHMQTFIYAQHVEFD